MCEPLAKSVDNAAAESCLEAPSFFNVIRELYVFFSSSTHRWNILKNCCKTNHLTVKRICDTRWSARSDAVKSLQQNYEETKKDLILLSSNENEKPVVRSEAVGLYKK